MKLLVVALGALLVAYAACKVSGEADDEAEAAFEKWRNGLSDYVEDGIARHYCNGTVLINEQEYQRLMKREENDNDD